MELPSLPTIQPLPVEHVEPLKPEIEHTEVSELSDTPYVTKQGVDRSSFTSDTIAILNREFEKRQRGFRQNDLERIAAATNLKPNQVKVYFQNRRARFKKKLRQAGFAVDSLDGRIKNSNIDIGFEQVANTESLRRVISERSDDSVPTQHNYNQKPSVIQPMLANVNSVRGPGTISTMAIIDWEPHQDVDGITTYKTYIRHLPPLFNASSAEALLAGNEPLSLEGLEVPHLPFPELAHGVEVSRPFPIELPSAAPTMAPELPQPGVEPVQGSIPHQSLPIEAISQYPIELPDAFPGLTAQMELPKLEPLQMPVLDPMELEQTMQEITEPLTLPPVTISSTVPSLSQPAETDTPIPDTSDNPEL